MDSFNDYFNIEKKQIAKLCLWFTNHTSYRIEYDDLFSEASLKLFELYRAGNTDKNFTFTSIKNHLINYIKANSVTKEIPKGLIRL